MPFTHYFQFSTLTLLNSHLHILELVVFDKQLNILGHTVKRVITPLSL